jgi:putative hydrolase of HD superfamily
LTRLEQQLQFLMEMDRLKEIFRRTYLNENGRAENSAEHSWHLAIAALLLGEYANESVDKGRVLELLLIHDIVEIDAGDTFLYDPDANRDKLAREELAAQRLFGLLPADQAQWFLESWREFEGRQTPEARFANSLDRLMPLLHNLKVNGLGWRKHGVVYSQVLVNGKRIGDGSIPLWEMVEPMLAAAVEKGYLATDGEPESQPRRPESV